MQQLHLQWKFTPQKKQLTNYINYDRIYNWKSVSDALVAELADALDLGSSIYDVGVQVSSGAPRRNKLRLFRFFFISKNSHPLHCSSLFAKGHVHVGYPFANAFVTPFVHYQPFARVPSALYPWFYHVFHWSSVRTPVFWVCAGSKMNICVLSCMH